MKRNDLRAMGLTPDQIDTIMTMNGADINREKAKAGQSIADSVLKAKGSTKLSVDPDLAKFIKDAPSRILSDQKGWSTALGKSLTRIQSEDAAYMAEYIKNYAPKALGA